MHTNCLASLVKRYPVLFDPADGALPINRWGIEVGRSWYRIIEAVLNIAQSHCRDHGKQLIVTDCKQKFGTLRIRFRGDGDDYMRSVTDAASALSARTCECCGRRADGRGNRAAACCAACARVA